MGTLTNTKTQVIIEKDSLPTTLCDKDNDEDDGLDSLTQKDLDKDDQVFYDHMGEILASIKECDKEVAEGKRPVFHSLEAISEYLYSL